MSRKSKAQIEFELQAKQDEIEAKTEERIKSLLPGLVATITTEITAKLMSVGTAPGGHAGAPTGSGVSAELQGFIRAMAVDFAKIADPKNERQAISPELAVTRETGRKELMELLIQTRVDMENGAEAPIYVLLNKCFLGGIKFEPQQENAITHRMEDVEINWDRAPNQHMRPVCARAKAIHVAYMKTISNGLGQLGAPSPGSWVITGNKIRRRGQFSEEPPAMSIRREQPTARQRKSIPVLGTLADPVVETV